MYKHVYIIYICLCISEINNSKDKRYGRKELGLFYYYKIYYP